MEPFRQVTGIAAPMFRDNVDTDALLPKQFLKTITRRGLGRHLFHDLRYDESGAPRPDFVLNRPPFDRAQILLTGANFGCGSSREHAPWALLDFGIRAIVAVSFADIFLGNCLKNGIVPVTAPAALIARLVEEPLDLTVSLESETIAHPVAGTHAFRIDPFCREMLLRGQDEIAWTEQRGAHIGAFEERQRREQPWLWDASGHPEEPGK